MACTYYSCNFPIPDLRAYSALFSAIFRLLNPRKIRPCSRSTASKKRALSVSLLKIVSDTSVSCYYPSCSVSCKVTQIRFPPGIPLKSTLPSHRFIALVLLFASCHPGSFQACHILCRPSSISILLNGEMARNRVLHTQTELQKSCFRTPEIAADSRQG